MLSHVRSSAHGFAVIFFRDLFLLSDALWGFLRPSVGAESAIELSTAQNAVKTSSVGY